MGDFSQGAAGFDTVMITQTNPLGTALGWGWSLMSTLPCITALTNHLIFICCVHAKIVEFTKVDMKKSLQCVEFFGVNIVGSTYK